jgi:hypothetical protein
MEEKLLINYKNNNNCYRDNYKPVYSTMIVDNDDKIINYCCEKTEYGKDIYEINKSIGLKKNEYIIPYLYGHLYGCQDDILHILCMINCPNEMFQNMNKWILSYEEKGKKNLYINEFKQLYGNEYGDYITLFKIYKNIKNVFNNKIKIYDDIKIDTLKIYFNKKKKIYNENIKYNKIDVQEKMSSTNFKILKNLEDTNVLNDYDDYYRYLEDKFNIYIEEIVKNSKEILEYSKKVYLNGDIVIAYLKLYTEYKYKIFYNNFRQENKLKKHETEKLINTKYIIKHIPLLYKTDDIHINIILSFIPAYLSNIYIYVKDDMYVNIVKKNVGVLNKIIYFYENSNTINMKYIMCHHEDSKKFIEKAESKLFIINNIKLEWLFRTIPHIFYDDSIVSIKYVKTNNNEKQNIVRNALTEFNNDKKNNLKVLLAYTYKLYSMNKLDIPKIVLEKN